MNNLKVRHSVCGKHSQKAGYISGLDSDTYVLPKIQVRSKFNLKR